MRLSGSQSMNGKASNTTQVCAVVMPFLIKQGKQIKRRRSFPDCSRLTSGCISACISASCTALGTWNLSISSIILATRLFPPFSSKVKDGSGSFRRVIAEIVSDLRFLIIFVVFRWRTTSQQAVCRRWCDQLDDGDSTTHFRVWHPKIGYGDPRGPSKEYGPQQSVQLEDYVNDSLHSIWVFPLFLLFTRYLPCIDLLRHNL